MENLTNKITSADFGRIHQLLTLPSSSITEKRDTLRKIWEFEFSKWESFCWEEFFEAGNNILEDDEWSDEYDYSISEAINLIVDKLLFEVWICKRFLLVHLPVKEFGQYLDTLPQTPELDKHRKYYKL